ncbi:hypothetical protein [Jiella sonneratiae]|uniref:Uncharacterized protein n=1 Tax=Jiella sonneratiae TaxID=2816856 RepID=A0ABS3J8I1_9HYPH|nr:hypothetical protein [Jiella sonneratiae]MBO0905971.1 hypothetical protein [Jiella sonneratiae]
MYERSVRRLEDPELVGALVGALIRAGYGRETIERALIRQAPVDLDVLAACYAQLTEAADLMAADADADVGETQAARRAA